MEFEKFLDLEPAEKIPYGTFLLGKLIEKGKERRIQNGRQTTNPVRPSLYRNP